MKFELVVKNTLSVLDNFEYEILEPDSLIEIFSVIEDAMYQSEKIDFVFEVSTQYLNVFVFGDLSIFLEQIYNLYQISNNQNLEYLLDFYDMGTNAKILFKLVDCNNVSIRNLSNPESEELISSEDLKNKILEFIVTVKIIIDKLVPDLNQMVGLKQWYTLFGITETKIPF